MVEAKVDDEDRPQVDAEASDGLGNSFWQETGLAPRRGNTEISSLIASQPATLAHFPR